MKAQRKQSADEDRFDIALDTLLGSGLLCSYMSDFWKFVDGEITEDEFRERMPS